MPQLHPSDQKFYCLLRYVLYWRFEDNSSYVLHEAMDVGLRVLSCCLQCDIQVVLAPSQTAENLEQHLSQLATQLTPDILQGIRTYLTAVRSLDYTLPEGLQKVKKNGGVKQQGSNSFNTSVME